MREELLSPSEYKVMESVAGLQQRRAEDFKTRMGKLFDTQPNDGSRVKIAKDSHVYESGGPADTIYFIKKGCIALLVPKSAGNGFVLGTRSENEMFGESCLSGRATRLESAIALEDTVLLAIPAWSFLARLSHEGLFLELVEHLMMLMGEQSRIIGRLTARQ